MGLTVDISGAEKKLSQIRSFTHDPAFQIALKRELAGNVGKIIKRTQAGRDKNERAFKAYAKAYRAHKGSGPRKPGKAQRGDTVDLTFTGQMLKAMTTGIGLEVKDNQISGSIFIMGPEAEKAKWHIKGGRVPKRDFFGFTKDFNKRINALVRSFINRGR